MQNLRNRNFLTLLDFSKKEMEFLLNLSEDLKRAKYAGIEQQKLKGKNIALIFEKILHAHVVRLKQQLMIKVLM